MVPDLLFPELLRDVLRPSLFCRKTGSIVSIKLIKSC